jgi:hypothetical protein
MALPSQPVTLSVEQIAQLNKKLSALRHDVNNHLSLITASIELIRFKPELAEKMISSANEQPLKISNAINKFSDEFESLFGITRER